MSILMNPDTADTVKECLRASVIIRITKLNRKDQVGVDVIPISFDPLDKVIANAIIAVLSAEHPTTAIPVTWGSTSGPVPLESLVG